MNGPDLGGGARCHSLVRSARGAAVLMMLCLGSATSGPAAVSAQGLPRVRVIATGGTIAGQAGAGQLTGAALVAAVPELATVARIEVEEFSRIGSSGMTPEHWLRLATRVNELFSQDAGLSGVVVTHGTDTMEETSYFLHLTVTDARPVVLTGSMRVSDAVSADGPANLLSAVRVAADIHARGRGALVVLNDEIHSARDVRKTDNNRVDTFVSSEWGALGVVDADGVIFRRNLITRHPLQLTMRGNSIDELPLVPIVADFAGSDGSVVRDWVEKGAAAIVVQAFGGGRTSPETRRAISDVAGQGIPVVLTSRVPEGRILRDDRLLESGILTAGDLPPHKARVLLMLALLQTQDIRALQAIFDTY